VALTDFPNSGNVTEGFCALGGVSMAWSVYVKGRLSFNFLIIVLRNKCFNVSVIVCDCVVVFRFFLKKKHDTMLEGIKMKFTFTPNPSLNLVSINKLQLSQTDRHVRK
jgi:hypothetical protein